MSKFRFLFSCLVMLFATSASVFAQAPPARSVLINTSAFLDEKAGITKLVDGEKKINAQFSKEIKEFQDNSAKLAAIVAELQEPVNAANQAAMVLKKEEGEALQNKLAYDKSNLEAKLNRAREDLIGPINFDIGKAISEFGKKNGYGAIFDASKLAESGILLFVGDATDITKDFIAFYNARAAAVPIAK